MAGLRARDAPRRRGIARFPGGPAVGGSRSGPEYYRFGIPTPGTPEVEIGYAFYPDWRGQGLAAEIANRCIGIGRSELGLRSLVADTRPHNAGSRHVMETVGMGYERDFTHAGLRNPHG